MGIDNDHDLLITISTKLDILSEQFEKHLREDFSRIAILEKDIKAAHRRMDWLTTAGIMSIVILGVSMWLK